MTGQPVVGRAVVLALPAACEHPAGRRIPEAIARDMLRALGVVICPRCHEVRRIVGRMRVLEP